MKSQRELVASIIELIQELDPGCPEADDLASYLYTVDPKVGVYIGELLALSALRKPSRQQKLDAGRLMEQVALLSFRCLEGAAVFKSYQSAGPQHDLLVSGDGARWLALCRYLRIDESRRGVLIEAKATASKVEDRQFARLCAVIDTDLIKIVGLGVFLTLSGASGFPVGKQRQRAVRDCRLRQILYHARRDVSIVVLDKEDLEAIAVNGSLPKILSRKIRDISELSGLPVAPSEPAMECDLPAHLRSL
jgi:hypothetical protein